MRRIITRRSSVHGKGLFALAPLREGERLIEYKGTVKSWRAATRDWERSGAPGHTFFFGLSNGRVIDGGNRGNSARWLNHACEANCQAFEEAGRVFIYVLRDIQAGEELFISYDLALDNDAGDASRLDYVCRCGSGQCRGTMLAA
ncbi:SET domain-containing protein [Paraburkholderia sp. J8-2]|uniref:SET domain-containing protein n=1 Tax=Paraburkholderia sp. J8-2 TaxID=2805440 RepID=UPI002AB5F04D|nr:SET domain-containing protein-lysine N-methyltransferase [Paraburkholderia sp. J8-2]